jgi:hypothetical protein
LPRKQSKQKESETGGKLRIGDDWNAITIIALSQDNPLKAVAELVENSIDAGARNVTVVRGRERGEQYLMVSDDGEGVRRNAAGDPDFRYVATHICDSIKRRLRAEGARGIQGEFGIGLLSFWTVGEQLAISSAGADGRTHEMRMRKGDPGYTIVRRRMLVADPGTRVKIRPLLPGIRQLSGEKIQWYLAAELRERIRGAGLRVKVIDRQARKEFLVEPRQFAGQLLQQLPVPRSVHGDVYVELYFNEPDSTNAVGLYRNGTRILAALTDVDALDRRPWTDGCLQGIIDVPFLNLTPATRTGVIRDGAFESFVAALAPLEAHLIELINEQRRAEEEKATHHTLRTIQRAFREAMLALPSEEYDFFEVKTRVAAGAGGEGEGPSGEASGAVAVDGADAEPDAQKRFFEYPGPMHGVRISPASCTLAVGASRSLHAIARDKSRRRIEEGVVYAWRIIECAGRLESDAGEFVTVQAPAEPCLLRVGVKAVQEIAAARKGEADEASAENEAADRHETLVWPPKAGTHEMVVSQRMGEPRDAVGLHPAAGAHEALTCEAEALITVTDSILPQPPGHSGRRRGLPGYTLEHAPGKLWRSRYEGEQNVIVVNSGHRDYLYAARVKALKLRYLVRLFAKEMVRKNFPGSPADELLERLIELSLYAEAQLR